MIIYKIKYIEYNLIKCITVPIVRIWRLIINHLIIHSVECESSKISSKIIFIVIFQKRYNLYYNILFIKCL